MINFMEEEGLFMEEKEMISSGYQAYNMAERVMIHLQLMMTTLGYMEKQGRIHFRQSIGHTSIRSKFYTMEGMVMMSLKKPEKFII